MKPYRDFAKDRTNRDDTLVVRFNNGRLVAIVDRYCTDPDCNCVAVNLEFTAIEESGKFKEKLFSFSLDTETWEISDIRKGSTDADYERLIKEFLAGLNESLKERFKNRLSIAKEFGREGVLEWFDDVMDERCFGYAQVFGENFEENRKFLFENKGLQFQGHCRSGSSILIRKM